MAPDCHEKAESQRGGVFVVFNLDVFGFFGLYVSWSCSIRLFASSGGKDRTLPTSALNRANSGDVFGLELMALE